MKALIILLVVLLAPIRAEEKRSGFEMPEPKHRIEKNVVYGMYSGLALLMDVHHPNEPNGYGVIHISGSGWTAPLGMDASQLKDGPHVRIEGWPLVDAGYTVFSVNHRSLPLFRYPDPVTDVQRAVRFIRANAEKYGIRPDRIGAIGGSSGGHLVSLLGLMDGAGAPDDPSPVNRLSAKVQCVVARAVPVSFLKGGPAPLLGFFVNPKKEKTLEYRTATEASPMSHVSSDDPPMLLIHGDSDRIIPMDVVQELHGKLALAGVETQLIVVEGADHGPHFPGTDRELSSIYAEAVKWMDTYLKAD